MAARASGNFDLYGTTRSAERAQEIKLAGVEPVLIESFGNTGTQSDLKALLAGAFAVVSFPPDKISDASAIKLAKEAMSIVYISSTAVYGKAEGVIDEKTPLDRDSEHALARLEAEDQWRHIGATIIRAPGIYGCGNGLHQRLLSGSYRLPGDGSNFVSRIHVEDLADMILSALVARIKKQVYVAGDDLPTTHREIVEWLVERLNLPFPESVPLEQCHYTQRGNRKVNAAKIRKELKKELKYPTFKEGYAEMLKDS